MERTLNPLFVTRYWLGLGVGLGFLGHQGQGQGQGEDGGQGQGEDGGSGIKFCNKCFYIYKSKSKKKASN